MTGERPHPIDRGRGIRVYLGDHMALIHGGRSLLERMRASPRHRRAAGLLDDVARELAAGEDTIGSFLAQLGQPAPRLKLLGATVAERLGRAKLNGRLARPAPLSELVELEGLGAVVGATAAFWEAVDRGGFAAREQVRAHADRCAGLAERIERARLEAAGRVLGRDAAEEDG